MIRVHHLKNFADSVNMYFCLPVSVNLEDYHPIAEVDTDDKDDAFRLTNNIESAWTENPGVRFLGGRARSTSIGDVLQCGSEFFLVAGVGFTRVAVEDKPFVA